jgi:hypothetical protein
LRPSWSVKNGKRIRPVEFLKKILQMGESGKIIWYVIATKIIN